MPSFPSSSPLSRRHVLALGTGALAVGALAACGSNTGRPDPAAATGSGGGAGKPTLSHWYHQYGEPGTQQAVERYAAQYPNASVKVTWKPGNYDQSMVATLLTDNAPDVFEYGNGPTIDMIKGGQVTDVTDLFGDAKIDFSPALIARVTHQGKIWAVPQVGDVQLLVYRKSMLQKAGVKPPTTMDELVAAAATLTTDKVKGLFLGNDGGAGLMGGPLLRSAGLDFLTPEGDLGFDIPTAAPALAILRRLYTDKHLLLGAPNDWFAADAFTQGLTAMQFTGLWTFPDITKAIGDDFGVLPWPAINGGKPNVVVGAYGACVNAKSAHVDAAKAYVKWLWVDGTDKQVDFATSYGLHIPTRLSLASTSDTLASGPAADAVRLARENGFVQNHLLWTPTCNAAFGDAMSRIVKDGADPAAELGKVTAVVRAELTRVAS